MGVVVEPRQSRSVVTAGRIIGGKVRLERLLRSGGMGTVWVGRHLMLDILVAVKLLAPKLVGSEEMTKRFAREAKATATIRSTNVVQVFDYGVDGDMPYLIMELLEGEDLKTRIKRQGPLPLAEVAAIVRGVAHSLQLAHNIGLVHRDIKPANIFLAREGDVIVPKILDFGVVKGAFQSGRDKLLTQRGQILGTLHYMSPEQIKGRLNVDRRADLWALAATAFHACVGRRPFPAQSLVDLVPQICTEPIPRATQLRKSLPRAIDGFFARALERSIDQRFQSARELADALSALSREGICSSTASRPRTEGRQPASVPAAPSADGVERPTESLPAAWGRDSEVRLCRDASRRRPLLIGAATVVFIAAAALGIARMAVSPEATTPLATGVLPVGELIAPAISKPVATVGSVPLRSTAGRDDVVVTDAPIATVEERDPAPSVSGPVAQTPSSSRPSDPGINQGGEYRRLDPAKEVSVRVARSTKRPASSQVSRRSVKRDVGY